MKTTTLTLSALAVLAGLAACTKENFNPSSSSDTHNDGNGLKVTLVAGQESEAGTRAVIGEASDSKTPILWSAGDKLSVFDGADKNIEFTLTGDAGKTSGTFEGEVSKTSDSYVALHPYQADATINSERNTISGVKLSSEQTAVAGSFDPEAALMVATESTDGTLAFKNVVGYIKVTPTSDCKKITLTSNNTDDALAGTEVSISLADGTPTVSSVSAASYSVSISGDIKAGSAYYIAALPATLESGFELVFTDSKGIETSKTSSNTLEIARNTITDLGSVSGTTPYVTFSAASEQGFKMTLPDSGVENTFEYSVGSGAWTKITSGDAVDFGGAKGDLRLRGTSSIGTADSDDYSTISFTNDVDVECTGDIRTLVDYEHYASASTSNARFTHLFYDCSVLTSAPELPAKTLADYCYYDMFGFCTKLKTAPKLSAKTLETYCYGYMFEGCKSLETAPALPAETLTDGCYYQMFSGCTSLTGGIELPAETLTDGCYGYMFDGCTSLTSITLRATSKGSGSLSGWLIRTVPSEPDGKTRTIYYADYDIIKGTYPDGWTVKDLSGDSDGDGGDSGTTPYVTFSAASAQGFKMTLGVENKFQYSVGNGEWTDIESGATVKFGGSGNDLRLRGTSAIGTAKVTVSEDGYFVSSLSTINFTEDVNVQCTGDIRTLVDWENYTNANTENARFAYLFQGCTSLKTAPELPATTLASCCYQFMFQGCSSLKKAPALPAETLASNCYDNMFSYCTLLDTAPELKASTLAPCCYQFMFNGCSSLKTAPKELPAEELANYCCYGMFAGCSSLTSAPELPATTLAESCYMSMFDSCTSLEGGIELPAEELANCCYFGMFSGCTSLSSITLKATASAEDALTSWLNGTTGGTIYTSLALESGTDYPSGWTVVKLD